MMTSGELPKLTRKQKIFVQEILDNPKQSATQAAVVAYNTSNRVSAGAIAAENLQKPQIMAYLQNAAETAEHKVIEAMGATRGVYARGVKVDDEVDYGVRLAAAREILDRVHGKATQRVEQVSTRVSISIDLTKATPSQGDEVNS